MSDDIPVVDLDDSQQNVEDPTPYTIIVDRDGNEKRLDELSAHPDNRLFRMAWSLSGTVITEDVDAAKEIFKEKVREARKPLLDAEDIVYMKALEDDDSSAKTASVTKKNALRDAPAASAITSATTIDELKAAWDTTLLGDSPYA